MIMGARDGADMFAVFDGDVRVVEVRRAGNGGVKIPEVRELVIHFRELELAATAGTGLALGGLALGWCWAGAGGCGCPRLCSPSDLLRTDVRTRSAALAA